MSLARAAIAAAAALAVSGAFAQAAPVYRADQPPVLERAAAGQAERERDTAVATAFAQAYQRAGSPRVLVLWHRGVSDQFSDERQVTRTNVSVGALARDNHAQQVVITWKDKASAPVTLLAPAGLADYETGLLQPLLASGVRLVDRNMAIRMTALKATTAASAPASSLEAPTVEAQAFADLADQVLQVQLVPDGGSPTGWRARLTVIEVRTGTTLADSLRSSTPAREGDGAVARVQATASPDGEREWHATDQGFVARARPVGLQQVAQRDAVALMARWPAR